MRNYRRGRERKTRMERRRDKMKELRRLRASPNYHLRKDGILGRIPYDYGKIVIVWVPSTRMLRTLLIKKLQSYGLITFMQDKYSCTEDGQKMWRGFLVEYSKKSEAETAAFDLPSHFQYLKSSLLESVIHTLVDCELLHRGRGEATSKVIINRKHPLRTDEADELHRTLSTYGPIDTFLINDRQTSLSMDAVCEVTYPCLTQAYLAMIMTDGFMNRGGILRAVLNKTPKDRQVLTDAKECIILLFQCDFPK